MLTGRTPDALVAELAPVRPLPALPERPDAGSLGDLLRRRPDIAAAEQRLHAATASIAAADADAAGELARYEQTVLLALEDTENALVRYARTREEDAHLTRAATDSASAAQLARTRFEAGAADLLVTNGQVHLPRTDK